MGELRKFVAPEIVYGDGAIALTGRYAASFGARKPLIVTDPGVIAVGVTDRVIDTLKAEGIDCAVFKDVSQNPRDFEVERGAERYRTEGCDVIIAVGGGSPMDCAKAIGIISTNKTGVRDFEGVDNVSVPGPPLICVPTTAGTSADVSQFSIITNSAKKVKFAIISKAMVPDVALIDPQTTLSMDPYLTACTGMDALVHAIEAIVSTASSPLTDIHAFEAIRLISKNLVQAVRHPENGEYRDSMMRASLEAGLAFSNASLGAVHAMAHSLGGLMDMPHGECNAILLEPVIDYNYAYAPERYALVAVCLGIDVSALSRPDIRNALLAEIRSLSANVGITARLADRDVDDASLVPLATNALADPCMVTNPRVPVLSEIVEVYRNAL